MDTVTSYNSGYQEVIVDEKESISERGTSLGGEDFQFSESVIDRQMQQFHNDRKTLEDPDQVNFNDQFSIIKNYYIKKEIFKRIMTDEELKAMDEALPQKCVKCECKFNTFTNRKLQCFFCGHPVCKDHSKKKREDPQRLNTSNSRSVSNNNLSAILNTSGGETEYEKKNFKKICDVCEDKYLKWQINYSFQQKKDQYDEATQKLEKQQKDILEKIKKQQDEISRVQQMDEQKRKQFEESKNELMKKIQKAEADDIDLKKENKEYISKIDKVDTEINQIQKQIKQAEEELKEKQNKINLQNQIVKFEIKLNRILEEKKLADKIRETDQEIENAHQIIEEIEQKITDNNLMMQRQKQKNSYIESRVDDNIDNIKEVSHIRSRKDQPIEKEKNCNVCNIY